MKYKLSRLYALLLCSLLLLGLLQGCGTQKEISKSGFYFDTIIKIQLYGTSDETYINECFKLAEKYENLFSNTIEDSDVSRINESAGEFVTVDPETIALIETGISYGELSQGKFDITIGNLSELWNISEIAKNTNNSDNKVDASVLPSEEEVLSLLSHVDYKNIVIQNDLVKLTDPDAKLDLGGIAKGYIADKMKEYLTEAGITSGFINLGGNVLTLGEKSNGSGYNIGIQRPFSQTGESIVSVQVKDMSVVSSGVYERYYRIDDTLYHHILDTTTGYPYENELYEVTIISKSSVDGDALSTTCFALGLEKGMELIESLPDTEAIFITSDEEIHTTSGIGEEIGITYY